MSCIPSVLLPDRYFTSIMLLFVILSVISCSQNAASFSVSSSYQDADLVLTLHIVPATWLNAALHCQLKGGVLASPTTSALVQVMLTAIAEYKLSSGVFIGVTDLLTRGDFKSLDRVPIANIPLEWAAGEPNNAENSERCLALTAAGVLADVSCYGVLPYFCRNSPFQPSSPTFPQPLMPTHTPSASSTPLLTTPSASSIPLLTTPSASSITLLTTPSTLSIPLLTTPSASSIPLLTTPVHSSASFFVPVTSLPLHHLKGYKWDARTGSAYKVHVFERTWLGSRASCAAEGGYLAIVNSKIESTVLMEIFKKSLSPKKHKYAFIGFIKKSTYQWFSDHHFSDHYKDSWIPKVSNDVWVTIHGQTIHKAGFDKWAPNEPNNHLSIEFCGTLDMDNGLLNDMICLRQLPYICEFTP